MLFAWFYLVQHTVCSYPTPEYDSNTALSLNSIIFNFNTHVQNIQTPATHRLDAPNYHGSNAMIANLHLSLLGKNTNIVHSDELKCSEQKDYQDISPSERPDIQIDVSPIILITNSTFSVSKVFFSATKPNHSIAKISNSFFTLDKCVLHSSAIDCPIIVTRSSSSRSEVKIINTQHVSASYGTLLPFVQLAPSPDSEMEDSTEVSVIGAELDISHCDLCFGTGPLVDFGEIQSMPDLSTIVTTTLIDTVILNTTSSSAPHPFAPLPTISQSVIGCSISDCTNHFAGTSVLNINHAPHFSAINTTVMACHTTLQSNADYTNKNLSISTGYYSGTHSFTRCLFKNCCATDGNGGAITIYSEETLFITECSFAGCSCSPKSSGKGGAFYIKDYDDGHPTTTISQTSVANCRAHWGSAVYLFHQRVTISELAVENCSDVKMLRTNKTGLGALYLVDTTEYVSIFNCIFSHCHNEHAGSVILELSNASHNCDSLAFRANSVEKQSVTRDFVTTLPSSSDFASMFSNCDSTSFGDSQPIVAVGTTNHYVGTLTITKSITTIIACVPTHKKLSITSFSLTEDPTDSALATCTVTVNEIVKGTMLLLLDNSLLRAGTTTAPTLQRMVSVAFDEGKGSSAASASVSFGPTGLLQSSLSDYVMMTASMKGWRIFPSISIAKCALSSTGNEINVTIHGANFEDGKYQVVLKKVGEQTTKTFNFGRQFGELHYSAVAYPENSAELEYRADYAVVCVTFEGQILNRSIETIVFTTPIAPARLIGIGDIVFTEGKKSVSLPFLSSGLPPSTQYTMILDSVPKGSESSHSRTLTLTTDAFGSLASSVQTVYPQTSLLPSFGTEYTVRMFALSSGTSFIALNSIRFSIPNEPSRLTSIDISYRSNKTEAIITLSGRILSPTHHTLFLKNTADDADTPTIPIDYSSTGSGLWSAPLSLIEDPVLKDGQTYTVTKLKEGGENGEDVPVEGTLTFTVTTELAVINDLSFEFHPDTQNTGKLLFSTVRMPTSTNLVVTVKGVTSFNLTGYLTISTAQTGSITATLFSTTATVQLEYGKTYTITKIVKSATNEEVFFTGKRDFTIPKALPRVISVRSSEWLDDGRGMTYTFFSVGLESEEHEMELTDTTSGSEREPVAKLTLSVGVDGGRQFVQGTTSFFPVDTATLKYSHSYKVTKITRVSKPAEDIFVDTITLSITTQQASITAVSCAMQSGTFEKNLIISYVGVGKMKDFLYPVFENGGVLIELPFVTFSGTEATQSIQIFGNTTNPRIEYGKTYTLVKVRNMFSPAIPLLLTKNFQIDIPAEKPRVTSVSQTNSTDGSSITLVFSTRLLEDGERYDFAVSSSSHSHSAVITATVSGTGDSQKATVAVSLNDDGTGQLYNSATYKLNSVTKSAPKATQNEETEILIESITFKTPIITPSISAVSVRMDTANGERNVIVRLEASNLNPTIYTTVYIGTSRLASYLDANTTTWFEFYIPIFNETSPKLSYGSQYTITRVENTVDCILLKTLSFEVPVEKPRLASAGVMGSSDHLSCTITFTTRLLEVGSTYTIRMTGTPTSGTGSEHAGCVTATVSTISSGQRAVATARLSEDGKNADLINGYTYVPKEVVKTSGKTEANIIIDNFVVKTPSGAPKVTSVKAYFKSGSYEWQLIIEFGGSGLGSLAGQRVTVNDGTKNIKLTDSLYFDSGSVGTINVNLSGSSPQLEYGQTYSVVKMEPSYSGDAPALKKGLKFDIPKEKPHLLGVSRQTNATDGKSTTLMFDSSKLEEGETYDITLSGTPSSTNHTAILTVVASTTSGTQKATGTAILSPPKENSLWHGMMYTPISMKKVNSEIESSSVVTHPFTFRTAADNRKVSSCRVGFTDLSERVLTITLGITNLPINSEFLVTINTTTPFDLKASGVFSSTSEGSVVATTFKRGQAPELEYGKTYTITSMRYKANGAPVVLSSPLSISIPDSTAQILEATCPGI
ncbi:hypothetical protein BLNAU_12808 [Blattamonas nauphoetae]|uniref:Uncharacterized protein n=1 Tax=Blattamonas nauphoetae TaxID=2049346 RepID=A0ABQ9XKJ3_9EUKA|nr:hypothetical protein BLNAU_12808 [Blattamonas nauphoetae]